MDLVLQLLSIYIAGFGCLAFGLLTVMDCRDPARVGWTGERITLLVLSTTSGAWFLFWLLKVLPGMSLSDWFEIILAYLSFVFPPLVNLAFYFDRRSKLRPHPFWTIGIVVSMILAVACMTAISAVIWNWFDRHQNLIIGLCYQVIWGWTAIYSILIMRSTRESVPKNSQESKKRRWYYLLLSLLLLLPFLFWPLFTTNLRILAEFAIVIMRSMPLCFVFVGLYYEHQYEFFDVIVKRGLFFFIVFGVLLGLFGAAAGWIVSLDDPVELALALTILGLPVLLATPYLHNRFSAWLDRIWLGRLYSSADAGKKFLSDLREVTTEDELLSQAHDSLSDIFQARVKLRVGGRRIAGDTPNFESLLEVPVRGDDHLLGTLAMGPRHSKMPYFSEDATMLGTLADILGRLLENIRLQERRKEQEQREKDLRLHASQSELKALRAQINPHFLFNALNAIAGLIHQKPDLAEETVEQLAEVFRYTLRRSELEWVRLEDEVEFLKAYLEVERARFGERLRTSISVEEAAKDVRVPGMMVQTLVENAVKHGVAGVRGQGVVEIEATAPDGFLHVEVRDNGPGPDASREAVRPGAGYGLSNIRRRLAGYFGEEASLRLLRDEERRMTVARLRFPIRPPESEARERAG